MTILCRLPTPKKYLRRRRRHRQKLAKEEKKTCGAKNGRTYPVQMVRDIVNKSFEVGIDKAIGFAFDVHHIVVPIGNIGRWRKNKDFYEQEAAKYDAAKLLGIHYRMGKTFAFRARTKPPLRAGLDKVIMAACKHRNRARRVLSVKFAKKIADDEIKRLREDVGVETPWRGTTVTHVSRSWAVRWLHSHGFCERARHL